MFPVGTADIRSMEQAAIAAGIAEYDLMCRAGEAAADLIALHYPAPGRIVVFCGGGNNGGDALVCARKLWQYYHREVVIYALKTREDFSGCARNAACDLPDEIPYEVRNDLEGVHFFPGDILVDGLLGIGYAGGEMRKNVAAYIRKINELSFPVIALDLPSGLVADSGDISPAGAVNAAMTITFGALKRGLFIKNGTFYRGMVRLVDIGLDIAVTPVGNGVFSNCDAGKLLPATDVCCHKNSRGRILVWGGSDEYPGAAALAAEAALRSGSGIVRLISRGECQNMVPRAVIFHHIPNGSDLRSEVEKFFSCSDVLVAGCGWGGDVPVEALQIVLDFPGKVVLDADGLNLLSRNPQMWHARENVIMTPHPGEAARLARAFGIVPESERVSLALALAEKLGAVMVLKGRDTVIASPSGQVLINSSGNFQLATAGSGDVLAGIIGSMAARNMALFESAALGAYIHGIAGEVSPGGVIADELPRYAGKVIRAIAEQRIY